MSNKEYERVADVAVQAFHRGQHRLSADKYLEATRIAPSHWSLNRYQIFTGYTSILTEKYFAPSDSDFDALRQIKRDKSEPNLFRCEAAFTLGLLLWNVGDRIGTAEAYRSAIRLGQKAKDGERKKTVFSMNGIDPMAEPIKKVGDILDSTVNKVQENLDRLESPLGSRPTGPIFNRRSDGSVMPPSVRSTGIPMGPLAAKLSHEDAVRLLSVGGDECDHCKKTLKELGVHHLDKCARCERAFYCSVQCQHTQWKAGHKEACRKPGQIEKGDYVRLEGIQKRPELNGIVVQIIKPIPDQPGRYEVSIHGGTKSISVAKEKFQRLRPLK